MPASPAFFDMHPHENILRKSLRYFISLILGFQNVYAAAALTSLPSIKRIGQRSERGSERVANHIVCLCSPKMKYELQDLHSG